MNFKQDLNQLLTPYQLHVLYQQEGSATFASFAELPQVKASGENQEDAYAQLLKELRTYATAYFEDFNVYYHFAKRSEQLPYLLRFLQGEDPAVMIVR